MKLETLFNAQDAKEAAYAEYENEIRQAIHTIKQNAGRMEYELSGDPKYMHCVKSALVELGYNVVENFNTSYSIHLTVRWGK